MLPVPPRARTHLALAATVVTVVAFYAWTAAPPGLQFGDWPDAYNGLARGMLHGHLYVDRDAPRQIRDLQPPLREIDYGAHVDSDMRDLLLHDGRLYSSWGPSPALLLFIPVHLLGLGDLSPGLAILLLTTAGFVCVAVLLELLVRRLAPATPGWARCLGVAILGISSVAPYLNRIPESYEVAVAGAYAFTAAGLLTLAVAVLSSRARPLVLALASGFFGLAFGARVDMLPLALLLVATYVALLRADLLADRAARRGAALALAVPFLACLVAYAAYNSARFGSPLQLGYRYQLSTGHTGRPHPSPRNIVPGLWYYLFAPPHWRLQFPFVWPPPPPSFWGPGPPWYGPVEKVAGLLPSAPIVLALPAAAMAAAGRRRRPLRDLAWPVALLCVTALSITLFIAYAAATATMRYAADFTTLVLLAALLVWFRALPRRRSTRRFRRGAVVTIGTLLGLYGLLVGTAFSLIGSRDQLAATRPQTFRTLERLFSPLPTAAAMVVGHPLVVAVNGDPTLTPWGYDHVSLDGTAFQVGLTAVYVQVASPRRGVFHLEARLTRAPGVHGRGTVRVGVSANQTGAYVTVAGAPAYFGILLNRGINQVRVETAADIPRVRPATDGSLAGLADLRVR